MQFDVTSGTVAWTWSGGDEMKFQGDDNSIVVQSGSQLYSLGLSQMSRIEMPGYGDGIFGPSEMVPTATVVEGGGFEATLLGDGLDGENVHYAGEDYLQQSTVGKAGLVVHQRKLEGKSPRKTPHGKSGAPTDPDT